MHNETFKVVRTDAGDATESVISLSEAVSKLQGYCKNKRVAIEALRDGQTLRTYFAFYKRKFQEGKCT